MPKVSIEDIRALRAETGAGVMDVKRALEDSSGSIEDARALLRERGLELSAKRSDRETGEGIIEAYVHPGRPLGAMLEIRCETDFVARTPEFTALAHDLVMHIAAMAPDRVADDDAGDGQDLARPTLVSRHLAQGARGRAGRRGPGRRTDSDRAV